MGDLCLYYEDFFQIIVDLLCVFQITVKSVQHCDLINIFTVIVMFTKLCLVINNLSEITILWFKYSDNVLLTFFSSCRFSSLEVDCKLIIIS